MLLGENYANLVGILKIFSVILGTELIADHTVPKIVAFCASLPPQVLQAALEQMGEAAGMCAREREREREREKRSGCRLG
jgi:hypothetical protein